MSIDEAGEPPTSSPYSFSGTGILSFNGLETPCWYLPLSRILDTDYSQAITPRHLESSRRDTLKL